MTVSLASDDRAEHRPGGHEGGIGRLMSPGTGGWRR